MTTVPLEPYHATDRRVYYGAPCSDMSREFKRTDDLMKRLLKAEPTASCTYFPMEGKYMVFIRPDPNRTWDILTNNFHESKQDALIEAITVLEAPHE